MKIDQTWRIIHFAEKPKGTALKAMQVDTSLLGLSAKERMKDPYIASMGVYVFRTDILLKLLSWKYPSCNDFGSEIIPSALKDHNVLAYIFSDYWEDIGTIKLFFDSNLALTEQPSKFDFNNPKTLFIHLQGSCHLQRLKNTGSWMQSFHIVVFFESVASSTP